MTVAAGDADVVAVCAAELAAGGGGRDALDSAGNMSSSSEHRSITGSFPVGKYKQRSLLESLGQHESLLDGET